MWCGSTKATHGLLLARQNRTGFLPVRVAWSLACCHQAEIAGFSTRLHSMAQPGTSSVSAPPSRAAAKPRLMTNPIRSDRMPKSSRSPDAPLFLCELPIALAFLRIAAVAFSLVGAAVGCCSSEKRQRVVLGLLRGIRRAWRTRHRWVYRFLL